MTYTLFLLCALMTSGCQAAQCDSSIVAPFFDEPVEVFGPFSVEEVEQRQMVEIVVDGDRKMVPFGYINESWQDLKAQMLPGDCLFFYRSDDASWEALHGREGYILFRDNAPVDAILTKVS